MAKAKRREDKVKSRKLPKDLITLAKAMEITGCARQTFYNRFCLRQISKYGTRRNLQVSKQEIIDKMLLNVG